MKVVSPTNVGYYDLLPLGFSVLAGTCFFLRCGTPTKSTPFRAQRLVSGSNIICNGSSISCAMSLLTYCLVSTSFEEQPPRWHNTRCLTLIPFVMIQVHRAQHLYWHSASCLLPSRNSLLAGTSPGV